MISSAAAMHRDDRAFVDEKTGRLPGRFAAAVLRRYSELFEREGRQAANLSLLEIEAVTSGGALSLAWGEDELRTWADRRAESARKTANRAADDGVAYLWLSEAIERLGMEPAPVDEDRGRTLAGAVARMCCPLWWRLQVRKYQARRVEEAAIKLGLVQRRGGLYASDETVERRRQQRSRNRAMLEAVQAVNELEQRYTLQQLADLSVSNPTIRRGELMVRMAGFEQYADSRGHVGEFYTWTCPSRMHYSSDRYDGTTPRQAQQYLTKQWAKARAAMKRAGVWVYGFRVAEPHHDGCPHWHMLFFMEERFVVLVRRILRRYALQVDGSEPGADKHRFKAVPIDKSKSKGTAAGYLAKYVAKNIDAFGIDYVDEDTTGKRDPKECAARVDAWASCWGIRQFQQVGGPSVTLWRELRRLGDEKQESEAIEAARLRADNADWCAFMRVTQERPLWLLKSDSGKPGRYGEPVERILGVMDADGVAVVTRVHEWRLEHGKKKDPLLDKERWAPSALFLSETLLPARCFQRSEAGNVPEVPGEAGGNRRGYEVVERSGRWLVLSRDSGGPWSPVNNCTGVKDAGKIESGGTKSAGGAGAADVAETGGGRSGDRRSGGAVGGDYWRSRANQSTRPG